MLFRSIRAIDMQHEDLIKLYNKLKYNVSKTGSTPLILSSHIQDIFYNLIDHLRTEELIMKTVRYTFLEEQKKNHKLILDTFDDLTIKMESNEISLIEVLDTIKSLILNHISDNTDFSDFYKQVKNY